jgi:subtilisin-like proprotein convertase family protein
MSTLNLTDPLLPAQWYLINTGQRGGDSRLDINVLPAWQAGFNGSGIVVAINDDGIDLTHPDLVGNIDATKVYDTNRDTTGQGFVGTDNSHGTVVGSIVGMAANGSGGVGVAYKATLVPALAIGSTVAFASANLFKANIAARVDVSVNSWGIDPAFAENFGVSGPEEDQAWGAELLRAATQGRNGLGMVIEVSAGNERANRADAGLSNFTGNKVTIAVGSVDENGVATDYSTPGASLLLTAFGGRGSESQADNSGFGAVSADIVGSGGYNTTAGDDGDYAYQNQGTSYSGPMVGAAAALILQANPQLGFRDVSAILAMTARQTDPGSQGWKTNGSQTWNLGGMHFSRDYGYGLLDVAAAVRLAQGWIGEAGTAANWVSATSGPMTTQTLAIPDVASNSLTVTTQVADAVRIDRMEFDLNLTALSPSQLKAEITSPSGTTITLFDQPLTRPLRDGEPDSSVTETPWPGTFTIGSTAFLGESSQGTWTLKLIDLVTGEEATFNSLTVRAWGSAPSTSDHYVLTNEFRGNKTLSDTSGVDTLNAAAMDRAVTLNLRGTSTLGPNAAITLAAGTMIENAFGGLGADILTGNDLSNLLRGHAGNDTLQGGAGDDTLEGGLGDDLAIFDGVRGDYAVSYAASTGVLTLNGGSAHGVDTLREVEWFQFGADAARVSLAQLIDSRAPQLSSSTPAAGARKVAADAPLVFSFDEPVRLGAGPIQLKKGDGTVVRSFGAGEAVVDGQTLRLAPAQKLGIYTDYILEFGAGAVEDLAGNVYAANTAVSFRTATVDELYHFFVVAFAAAPGATYMGQLAEAYNYFSAQPVQPGAPGVLQQIVEIFTSKRQFTDPYPLDLTNRELATRLVDNIVKTSASPAVREQAVNDIETVLGPAFNWSRGKMLFTVFGNLANKPLDDVQWGLTARQFQKQLTVARHYTEEMGVATEDVAALQRVLSKVGPDTDVSTTELIVQIIGSP